MKILAAVDGSPCSKRLLAWLAAHEEWRGPGTELTILTVVPPPPPRAAALLDKVLLREWRDEEIDKVFKPVRALLAKQGIEARCVGKPGDPTEVIAKQATDGGYDLVVMGSHGHGQLAQLLMGSVTSAVMARCRTPVLVVR